MNIAVVAANGRSGSAFVQQALAAGHSVRAGVYKNNTLVAHPSLTIIECDATQPDDVARLIEGQDAVVSFIGHTKGAPADVQTKAIEAIIAAMQAAGVTRLVSLTGTGVRFPGDTIPFIDKFLNLGVSVVDPSRVQDGKNHVAAIKDSNLEWTVLRVLKLQDIKTSPFSLTPHGPTKLFVSRKDVAKATLEVLESRSFIHQAPILSPARSA